jgi:hypothetical protein
VVDVGITFLDEFNRQRMGAVNNLEIFPVKQFSSLLYSSSQGIDILRLRLPGANGFYFKRW